MTIHRSDAVNAGIAPDYAKAGVVLCRSAEYVTADDSLVSGDTLQMVPVPDNAKILAMQVYYSALPASVTGCDIGYNGDPDAFFSTIPMTGANIKTWPNQNSCGPTSVNYQNTAGFLYTFTADDTIDIAFTKAATKIPTSQHIYLTVWYKMVGTIADET